MGKRQHSDPEKPASGESGVDLPSTRDGVLQQAAQGKWQPFFDDYLRPCWQQVLIACRSKNISITDSEDVFQELIVRIVSDSQFSPRVRQILRDSDQDSQFRGNLAGKYLKYRELPVQSAKFRTYLKNVIHNLVLEQIRRQHQGRALPLDEQKAADEPWSVDSIGELLDRRWAEDCLTTAACRLKAYCEAATTKGEQRLFEILFLSLVEDQSPGAIAARFGVDRTNIIRLRKRAQLQFVRGVAGTANDLGKDEIQRLITTHPAELKRALEIGSGRAAT